MIELGLARIGRLLSESTLPWRAIHVAGTNGKGSVCAYVSAMLHATGLSCGRFTSPHLIDRWDCITINEKVVQENLFRQVEDHVMLRNRRNQIGASEFELLTATAFEIFAREKVKIGVIEVGLGGRHDATNVLKDPLVTVITSIGIDHEAFLGNTVEAIAYQKAGIMKKGVPCIVDSTNSASILQVLASYAKDIGAGPLILPNADTEADAKDFWHLLEKEIFECHQRTNIALAHKAVMAALRQEKIDCEIIPLADAIKKTVWPGRLQHLSIQTLTSRKQDILLDGAHNVQSAAVLEKYVDTRLRKGSEPITWVIGASRGKNLIGIFASMIRSEDNVVAVQFGRVDGMPWVNAASTEEILETLGGAKSTSGTRSSSANVTEALEIATSISDGGPLIVAGSLYLVSDVLRQVRSSIGR